jgi:hypothetical protein
MGEILGQIDESDHFLVLLSVSATASRGVREEIDYAHYCQVNINRPTLIPLILDADVAVPRKLVRYARLPFSTNDYSAGFSALLKAVNLDPPHSVFAGATELEVTRTTSEKLDSERESLVFTRSLIEHNPDVRASFESLAEPAKSEAGGRFRLGKWQIIAWRTPSYTGDFHADEGRRDAEILYLVFIPLYRGYHRGYSVDEQVVAQISAKQNQIFTRTGDDEWSLKSDTLTLTFEGFVQPEFSRQRR